MPTICKHPNHQKLLENYRGSEVIKNIRINTPKYGGEICGVCWCHEMGNLIEKYPIYD